MTPIVSKHLPAAEITFDRYHIKAQLTCAVDEVRRDERVEHAELLRHTRYLWGKRPANLTAASTNVSRPAVLAPEDRACLALDAQVRRRL